MKLSDFLLACSFLSAFVHPGVETVTEAQTPSLGETRFAGLLCSRLFLGSQVVCMCVCFFKARSELKRRDEVGAARAGLQLRMVRIVGRL